MTNTGKLGNIVEVIRKFFNGFFADSLYRNSFYLMMATAVMSGFGFFFWLISAHVYSSEMIGLATTLISVMNMIAVLSLMGFDAALVRFLPHSEQKNEKINTGLLIVGLASLVLSFLFVLFVPYISPRVGFIRQSPLTSGVFMVFCVLTALNMLTDSVFLANRKTNYTLIINTSFSMVKMVMPLFFIGFGAWGVFLAAATAQAVGFGLSIYIMIRRLDFKPRISINTGVLKLIRKYSFGNYVSGVLNLIPLTLLPVIITGSLGPQQAAYYYIVMMIGSLLFVIPQAVTGSLFAEGSHNEEAMHENIYKAIKIIGALLIPSILVLLFGGGIILSFFGKGYLNGGVNFMNIIAISGLAVAGYAIINSFFRVKKYIWGLMATNLTYMTMTLVLTFTLLRYGLLGIGFAWTGGNLAAGVIGILLYKYRYSRLTR
jgi:O-antigen/teichoic acid export membrane protein